MSFFFNTGVEALKTMDESKGNQNSVVLSNIDFRKAFSLAIDRAEYVTATEGYKPAFALMNNLYFYDVYNDPTSSYRNSEPAMQAVCNLYGVEYGEGTPYATLRDAYLSINGYNLTEAKALMATACTELVEAGLYVAGDPIVIRIGWAKGALDSAANQQLALVNKYINAAAEGSGFGTITFEAVGNIENRYDAVPQGEYAIGYGAWGGAAFYPFRNFQVYCDTEQYSINELGCWDPATEMLTLTVGGEDVTMTWQDWSRALIGTGPYAGADFQTNLEITAAMEELYLNKLYRIPLAATTACFMLGYQIDYYTQEYNIMYDFGGMRLMNFAYTDAEWAEYVASQNGVLSYE
jgi:oligopeptide transport system substrate-binding protein